MAYFYRLACRLFCGGWFAVLVAVVPGVAHAYPAASNASSACTVSPCYSYRLASNFPWRATRAAAVGDYLADHAADPSQDYSLDHLDTGGGLGYGIAWVKVVNRSNGSTAGIFQNWFAGLEVPPVAPVYSCPGGGTVSGSQCVCPAGQVDTGSACTADPAPVCAGLNASQRVVFYSSSLASLSVCVNGVTASGRMGSAGDATHLGGVWGPFTCVAGCAGGSPAEVPAPLEKQLKCTPLEFAGSVNGVPVCIAKAVGNTIAVGPTATASAAAGGAAPALGPGAPAGATGSTSVTTCAAGACTVTTTYTNSSGAPVGESKKEIAQASLCTTDPTDPTCTKNVSSFAGVCGAPFDCSGDAIMCAIAREQYARNCAFYKPTGTESDLYGLESVKTGNRVKDLPGNSSKSIGPGDFSTTELLGAAAGMTDITLRVFRSTVTLPFSVVNVWLERLGVIMQAVTFLLCIRIVSRG